MKSKTCFKCNIEKSITEYYVHKQMTDGHLNKCKECTKKDVNIRFSSKREEIREYDKHRQRYSIHRILKHRYASMKQRVEGRGKHSYISIGMPLLSWSEFLEWHNKNIDTFQSIYNDWVESGFIRKLAPSIDRINNQVGYLAHNMQWITQSQNSSKYNKKLT